ncbi:MAG: hypothetical protein JSV62_16010 [Promethearchaeota archaeon]|nr:MAG: hypothetical protein JSV62_16010 [Candidatus Lokiarchaeota archaeon]
MVQVLERDREKESKYSIVLKEIIVLEELPMEEERIESAPVVKREKKPNRALRKLLEKAKYNANYLKDSISIKDVKNRIHYRNHALY